MVVFELSYKDLSVKALICDAGATVPDYFASSLTKCAVLLPSETDVSAANVDLATCQTLFDLYEIGHDLILLTRKTICPL